MIEVHNVCKTYLMGDEIINAVNHISFSVQDGSFISVTGKSGSGKSTLLHLLGGLDPVDSGRIIIDGKNICLMEEKELSVFRKKNLGFVFQFFNLLPELTLEENILFPAKVDKTVPDKAFFDYIIDVLGLGDRLNHLPSQLSGGQLQRAAIARALILKPKILLLDEPTGNLDAEASDAVINMLIRLHKDLNQTAVLVTHDKDIADTADSKIIIRDGVLSYE